MNVYMHCMQQTRNSNPKKPRGMPRPSARDSLSELVNSSTTYQHIHNFVTLRLWSSYRSPQTGGNAVLWIRDSLC